MNPSPVIPVSWDRIYPRCVWCRGENYMPAVLAYSAGKIPCAAVNGCGEFLPLHYRRTEGGVHILGEPVKLRYPGGKDGMFQVSCSCGEYSTSPCGTPEAAMKPALEHVRAKSG